MRIVGRAIFPKLGAGSFTPTNLGEGAAVKASLFADPTAPPDDIYSFMLFRLKPGVDVTEGTARLNTVVRKLEFCGGENPCVKGPDRPGDLSNYTRVRGTPSSSRRCSH